MGGSLVKGLIGQEDLHLWNGNDADYTRLSSTGVVTMHPIGHMIDVLALYGNHVNFTGASIVAAGNMTTTTNKTLLLQPGTWTITSTMSVTCGLYIPYGAIINVAAGVTFNLDGPLIVDGVYQIFSGTGTVTFGSGAVKEVYPEWWGTTDFGLALQSAINAGSKVVIGPGTHTFTVAHYSPGDTLHPIGVYLKDDLHIVIEKGATVTQAAGLKLKVFFAGHMWGTGQATVLTNVTIEVYGMIDGNYVNQGYPNLGVPDPTTAHEACPIALFATKSNFPIIRAKNFGRYGALVLYYGPHLNVGHVYAENSYDNTYWQAKALDLENVAHANVISVMGDNLQGAIFDLPDGGSFINIDNINGKNSYSTMQIGPSNFPSDGLHDIQIGNVVGEGTNSAGGTHGILVETFDGYPDTKDISFGNVSISGAWGDGIKIVNSTPTTQRARRIQFGNVLLRNNGQNSGNGFTLGWCDDVKIGNLIIYDDQTPKTQGSGLAFLANSTHVTVSNGDVTGSGTTYDVYGYDPTNHHLLDVVGFVTENSGTSAAIASGATIAHGLVAAPTFVSIGAVDTGLSNIYWTVDATNITVNYTGGGTHTFYWYARTARSN